MSCLRSTARLSIRITRRHLVSSYSFKTPTRNASKMAGIVDAVRTTQNQFDIEKDIPSQAGKVAVVTGATEGIGYGITTYLLKNGIEKVFCIGMQQTVWEGAQKDCTERLGAEYAKKMIWLQGDLSDYQNTTKLAKQITEQSGGRLDILVLCAAYAIMPFELRNGVNLSMAVNMFGHVTLTSHLLPILKKTSEQDKVRIVAFSSNAHEQAPASTKFASLEEINVDQGPTVNYGVSKLAQLLYMRYLAKHLTASHPNILANAVHPGIVATKASERKVEDAYPILGKGMSVLMQPFKKDQFEGATSALFAATKTDKSGEYICPPATVEPGSELSRKPELAEAVMALTKKIVSEQTQKDSVEKGCPFTFY